MNDEDFATWEAGRSLGEEILHGICEIKSGNAGRSYTPASFSVICAREALRLNQAQFATLLGVSVGTLQDWERGKCEPSGAAKTILTIAQTHPEVLLELVGSQLSFETISNPSKKSQ